MPPMTRGYKRSRGRAHTEGEEIFALLESHGSKYVFEVFLQSTRTIESALVEMSWYEAAVRLRSAILREPIPDAMAVPPRSRARDVAAPGGRMGRVVRGPRRDVRRRRAAD